MQHSLNEYKPCLSWCLASVLRLLNHEEEHRNRRGSFNAPQEYNFRQAVRFAELGYHLESVHPLFFEWTADPISEIVTQKDQAFASYFVLNLAHSGRTFRVNAFEIGPGSCWRYSSWWSSAMLASCGLQKTN